MWGYGIRGMLRQKVSVAGKDTKRMGKRTAITSDGKGNCPVRQSFSQSLGLFSGRVAACAAYGEHGQIVDSLGNPST